jgi:hypothetical protein
MENKEKNYLFLILLHVLIGVVIFLVPFVSKVYGLLIFGASIFFIVSNRNKNNEVLLAAAYVVGSEVFLRMTEGNPNHEFSKYSVIVFILLGMFYSGFSKNAVPYWVFLITLLPGVFIATQELSLQSESIRKSIFFNISGPVCLGIASIYCYNRKITMEQMNRILLYMALPIISCTIYLFFYSTYNVKINLTGTGSNTDLSGGFGPNQVATVLGIGMFVFFSRFLFFSKNYFYVAINLFITFLIGYRGLLTFSRGGMITGLVMIVALLVVIYRYSKKERRLSIIKSVSLLAIIFSLLWGLTQSQTGGLIGKRYANQDALGRTKKSNLTGREDLAAGEIQMFIDNPVWGVGVAKGTEIRSEKAGYLVASHDELTRMLAEHGLFGIFGLLLLIITPIILYADNKQHIYMFCFLIFWFLTINHAAMRTASPSFIYALALLKVKISHE